MKVEMSLGKAIGLVAGSTVVLAAVGYGLGLALASLQPNYYMVVFGLKEEERVHISTVASVTGLLQGMFAGLIVGVALVAILVWREIALTRVRSQGS